MDVIEKAMLKERHITKNMTLQMQTWAEFEKVSIDKKVFLFGVGEGASFLFDAVKDIEVEGILDNDKRKHGILCSSFFECPKCGGLVVSGIEEIQKYKAKDVAILITNLVHYEEIFEQVHALGIENIYSLLMMEVNRRKSQAEYIKIEATKEANNLVINQKKVVFFTMGGYSGHGKYIAEKILELRDDLEIVWLVEDISLKVPEGIRLVYVKNRSSRDYEMKTAKIWVFDSALPMETEKQEGQIYVQTKHWSSITLKAFGLTLSKFRKNNIQTEMYLHDSALIDYAIVGSKFDEETFRSGFSYNGEVFYAGSPRTDVLFRHEKFKRKIFDMYGIDPQCNTVLYAPTFRIKKGEQHAQRVGDIELDFRCLQETLERKFGGSWKVLLRLHPNVAMEVDQIRDRDGFIDVSLYSDSQELIAAVDAVVTDYSSIMFEPAFIKKPVFLFAPDREKYIDGERELLIPYDTLPFSTAITNEELVENILGFDKNEYETNVEMFLKKYDVCEDGHASTRAAKFIISLLNEVS